MLAVSLKEMRLNHASALHLDTRGLSADWFVTRTFAVSVKNNNIKVSQDWEASFSSSKYRTRLYG